MRPSLCSRCGAVVPVLELDATGRGEGACPECGLGFRGAVYGGTEQPRRRLSRREKRRRLEDHGARTRQAFESLAFPAYGLDPSWTGRRWAGGWESVGARVYTVDLGHDDLGRSVRVRTAVAQPARERPDLAGEAQQLAHHLWHDGGAAHTDALRAPFRSNDPTLGWEDATIAVDGSPQPFRLLAVGTTWVAISDLGSCVVSVVARGVGRGEVGLRVVDDLSPYLVDMR